MRVLIVQHDDVTVAEGSPLKDLSRSASLFPGARFGLAARTRGECLGDRKGALAPGLSIQEPARPSGRARWRSHPRRAVPGVSWQGSLSLILKRVPSLAVRAPP